MNWMPIDSAPDSVEVIAYRADGGVFAARRTTPEELFGAEGVAFGPEWWNDATGWLEGDLRPTHWMPLPPPPEAES